MKKNVLAIALLSALSTTAMAEGFYAAVDAGQSSGKDICTNNPPGVTGCEDTATLFRAAVGTQITPMWGAEVSYGSYGKASAGTFLGISVDWEASGLQISGTGTFPVADAFSLIGKLGIARTDLKVSALGISFSETSTNLAFGIGAQYDVTQSVAFRAQYEDLGTVGNSNTTGTTKASLLSAGVVFKF